MRNRVRNSERKEWSGREDGVEEKMESGETKEVRRARVEDKDSDWIDK